MKMEDKTTARVAKSILELPYGVPFKTLNLQGTQGIYMRVQMGNTMVVVLNNTAAEDRLAVNLDTGKVTSFADGVQCVLLDATLVVEKFA